MPSHMLFEGKKAAMKEKRPVHTPQGVATSRERGKAVTGSAWRACFAPAAALVDARGEMAKNQTRWAAGR